MPDFVVILLLSISAVCSLFLALSEIVRLKRRGDSPHSIDALYAEETKSLRDPSPVAPTVSASSFINKISGVTSDEKAIQREAWTAFERD